MRRLPIKKPEIQPHIKIRAKWAALVPDDMSVERCKEIFQDIAGTWQGGVLKNTAVKIQQSNEDDLEF